MTCVLIKTFDYLFSYLFLRLATCHELLVDFTGHKLHESQVMRLLCVSQW